MKAARCRLLLSVGIVAGMAACAGETGAAGAPDAEPEEPGVDRPVVLVTGSTDGLGREVARQLGAAGAHVIVHGRNSERGMAVVREIEAEGSGSASFHAADLASLEQVRQLAEAIRRDHDRLDVLINNAGIGRGADETRREVSADGHELRFQVNYLSGFLLTRTLLPLLRESAPSRIINVSSLAAAPIEFDNVMLERDYNGSRAYGQSKLAQILFTFDLAEELDGTGVTVATLHPATMMPTTMVLERGGQPMSDLEDGVEAVLRLVTDPDLESGQFFNGMQPARANAQAYDREARDRLRRLSEELVGP